MLFRTINYFILLVVNLSLYVSAICFFSSSSPNSSNRLDNIWLNELCGEIDETNTTVETVDKLNNYHIYPRIISIVSKDYFKFFKVNLRRKCPFWSDDSKCAMRYCQVESCHLDDLPIGLKSIRNSLVDVDMSIKYMVGPQQQECEEATQYELGYINTTISAAAMEDFALWQAHDDLQEMYCTLPEDDGDAEYVDLSLNPERYTGYKGPSANRVWKTIYMENCFRPKNLFEVSIKSTLLTGMCLEKRAFYRAISGLHSSINIHLSAKYLLSDKGTTFLNPCGTGTWGPNIEEFERKFGPQYTKGEGTQWLRNLYFLFLVELRALQKAAPVLEQVEYYTGNDKEDEVTRFAVHNLLGIVKQFPQHFNERSMFSGGQQAQKLKEEFRYHFRNISTIMDCVGCDKCRLWGKLQVQGLGTALKILFSNKTRTNGYSFTVNKHTLKLERSEIIALFNSFARLSTSIYELDMFRKILR
ncbi:ero1-like protein isoform X2 [Daktulosphaira vitifoliae]|uniref:ero1-like protein isoform X2 n=1 Tax=Daktulosphaira vitifoliae TaxID=58002 RepID=UPI0021A9A564|nr:ero1-like protein isoform X2 [Daktulosphaira vitifoliae]